jgi:hypothetical protein
MPLSFDTWNSTFDMIERFLEQQEAIILSLRSKEVKNKKAERCANMTDEEIAELEAMIAVLRPLKAITKLLSDEKLPTVSLIYTR